MSLCVGSNCKVHIRYIPRYIQSASRRAMRKYRLDVYSGSTCIYSQITMAKQFVFSFLIISALFINIQGEPNSLYIIILTHIFKLICQVRLQGEALFVWYATDWPLLHTPLDECRYTSPAGDTSVTMPISLSRKPMWSVTNRDSLGLPPTPGHLLTGTCFIYVAGHSVHSLIPWPHLFSFQRKWSGVNRT